MEDLLKIAVTWMTTDKHGRKFNKIKTKTFSPAQPHGMEVGKVIAICSTPTGGTKVFENDPSLIVDRDSAVDLVMCKVRTWLRGITKQN